ncbi:MAG: hypothetical protein IIU51_10235, partial [Bacteroidaceae bacterium]|nr:hypothetical protein [Bacteroidaceae bacterium]
PKNSLVRQYRKLLSMDGVDVTFKDDALSALAEIALKRKTGARGLRAEPSVTIKSSPIWSFSSGNWDTRVTMPAWASNTTSEPS